MTDSETAFLSSSHGYDIQTDVALFGLRRNAGGQVLRVSRGPVLTPSEGGTRVGYWPEKPGQRAEVSILELGDRRHLVTVGTMARLIVDPAIRSIIADFRPLLPSMLETTVLMSSPLALCIAIDGKLALHASAVEVEGESLLLAATGSGGKTTLAAGFHMAGHRVLSDDLVAVDPAGGVEPAPALLRLRADAAAHLEPSLRDTALMFEDDSKRYHEVSANRRGDGAPLPARAIIFLEWAADSRLTIDRVSPSAAIQNLWPLSFYLTRDPGPAECFERLADLVDRTPAYVLARPRDFGRIDETIDAIMNAMRSTTLR